MVHHILSMLETASCREIKHRRENDLDIEEMLEKYSKRLDQCKKKKKKKKKKAVAVAEPPEWVDTSFIKAYTEYDQMRELLDSLDRDCHSIAERCGVRLTANTSSCPARS